MSHPSGCVTVERLLFDASQNSFKCDLTTAVPDYLGDNRCAGHYRLSVFVGPNKASDRGSVSSLNGDERPGIEDKSHQAERFAGRNTGAAPLRSASLLTRPPDSLRSLAGRAAGDSASNSSRDQPCSARISSSAAPSAAWRSLWRIAVASHAEMFVLSAWAAARKACPSWGSNETLNFSTLTV